MTHPSDPETNEAGEVVAARDWLGNRFAVGEMVMYCVGAGRGQLMALGRVLKILATEHETGRYVEAKDGDVVSHENSVGKWTWIGHTEIRVSVQVLTERTSGEWGNGKRSRAAMVNPLNITAIKTLNYAALSPEK